jgi:hypothetical protein
MDDPATDISLTRPTSVLSADIDEPTLKSGVTPHKSGDVAQFRFCIWVLILDI